MGKEGGCPWVGGLAQFGYLAEGSKKAAFGTDEELEELERLTDDGSPHAVTRRASIRDRF
jgi:hypothetical protein